jgi:hypothetical protein
MRGADAEPPAPPTAGVAGRGRKGGARMTTREQLQQQAYDRAIQNEMNYYG